MEILLPDVAVFVTVAVSGKKIYKLIMNYVISEVFATHISCLVYFHIYSEYSGLKEKPLEI